MDSELIIKVLAYTVLSPFFAMWVPVFYLSQGFTFASPTVINSFIYFGLVSGFWGWRYLDSAWRNGHFFPQKLDWGEQVVVITGGAGGLGGLLANTLAIRGVTVAILDLVPLETENSNIVFYKCDVSKWESVHAVAAEIVKDLGQPTILVNNAGVVQGKLVTELTEEDVNRTIGVNLTAHFWTLKAFLPGMIKRKSGHVITVSSAMGLVGAARMTDYNATKAALVNLNESLRYELDHVHHASSVRTTLVLAGYVNARMFARSGYSKLMANPVYRFLVPPVQPHSVIKGIIAALDAHESREIALPFFVHLLRPAVALAPSWFRDLLQWISQADYVMDGFARPVEDKES